MEHQALPGPYPDLADVRRRLDAWRRTRPGHRPIPEEFWAEYDVWPLRGDQPARTTPPLDAAIPPPKIHRPVPQRTTPRRGTGCQPRAKPWDPEQAHFCQFLTPGGA